MDHLILKQNNKHMTIQDQFNKGIKIRPHRLQTVNKAIVIKNNQITQVYHLDTTQLIHNAITGRIDINSIIAKQDFSSDLINKFIKYETSIPASIKNPYSLLSS